MSLIWQRRAIPILAVLALVAVGMLLIVTSVWRPGMAVLALAAAVGGGLRAALPERFIGVLAVRGRTFDSAFLFALAVIFGVLVLIPW